MSNTEPIALPRSLVAVFFCAILAILAFGGWIFVTQKTAQRQIAEQELQAVVELKLKQLADWRQDQLLECSEVGASRFFADGVARWLAESRPEDAADILSRLRSLQAHYDYTDIVLVDPEGKPRLSLSGRLEPLHPSVSKTLAAALRERKPLLSDLHDEGEGIPHLAAIAPIFSEDAMTSAPSAAIIMSCDAAHFLFPLIQSWPMPSPSAETLLVRREGDSVLFLNELRHQTNTALKLRIPLTQTDLPAVMAVLGKEGVVNGKDYRGVKVLSMLKAVPDSPWFMVAKVDADEIFAVWRIRSALILTLMLALAAFVAAAVLVLWQRNAKAHYRALFLAETSRRQSEARHGITLRSIGDAVIATDFSGRVELMNPVAENLTGWKDEEARGKHLAEVFRVVNEDTRQSVEDPVAAVLRDGKVVGLANHTLLIARDGTERPIADSGAPIHDEKGAIVGVVLVFRDQTQERAARKRQELVTDALRLLNRPNDLSALVEELLRLIKRATGFEAVGLRLREGDDFPYYVANGFSETFLRDDRYLCVRNEAGDLVRDANGNPELRCMCGNVLRGRADPKLPFFTEAGSFWTNSTTQLLAGATGGDRQTCARNRCHAEGYESVALIPLRSGDEIVGLLQLNDHRPGRFTTESIRFYEGLAASIGVALKRARAQEEIQRTAREWQNTFDATNDAIWVLDADHRVVRANKAAEQLLHCSCGEMVGQQCWAIVHGAAEPHPLCPFERARKSGKHETMELEFDGRWFDVTADPIRDATGQYAGAVHIISDITARKRAEEERQQLLAQLLQSQKLESIGTLAGGVAHEINNPIMGIMSYAQLIEDKLPAGGELARFAAEIGKETERVAAIVRNLLAFARVEKSAHSPARMCDIVEGTLSLLRTVLRHDQITLSVDIPQDLPKVKCRTQQLQQVVMNLVTNARDALNEKYPGYDENKIITIRAEEVERAGTAWLRLTVEDHGSGISEAVRQRIFEPFYTTKPCDKGTGLGLSVSYGIIRDHRGEISVESEPGEWTRFHMDLPVDNGCTFERGAEG